MTAPDLKPCPFCGGVAEQDYQQPYRSISAAKLGKACSIYCMSCSANTTLCHEDHAGTSPDDLMAELVAAWNTRAPLAEALAVPEVKAAELYVVWSHEHGCWWRPDSAGYTNDVRSAGVYTRAEAMSISHRGRDEWRAGTKPDELPVRITDLPDWAQAAIRAIGERAE